MADEEERNGSENGKEKEKNGLMDSMIQSLETPKIAPSHSVDSLLECGICCDYLNEPRETNCCHSLYCQECLKEWQESQANCPTCRAPSSSGIRPNIPIQRFIESMPICCPYKMEGCLIYVARADLSTHKESCRYRPDLLKKKREQELQRIVSSIASLKGSQLNLQKCRKTIELLSRLVELSGYQEGMSLVRILGNGPLQIVNAISKFPSSVSLRCLFLVAQVYLGVGLLKEAEIVCQNVFVLSKNRKEESDFFLQVAVLYAKVEIKVASYESASKIYEEAEILAREIPPKDSNFLVDLLCASGVLAKKQSKFSEAIEMYKKAMKMISQNDPKWPELLFYLAEVYRKIGRFVESRNLYQQSLSLLENMHGRNNSPLISDIANGLGMLEKKCGNYSVALEMYSQALRVGRHFHGESFSDLGIILTNIGDIYRKKGEYSKAERMYKTSLGELENKFGAEHIEVADTLNSLGLVSKKKAKYDEAMKLYERALHIAKKTFGEKPHYKKGVYYANLGDVYRKTANFEEAFRCYEVALENIKQTMGSENSEVADILHSCGLVKHQEQKYEESIKLYDQAIELVSKEFGERHYKRGMYLCNKGLAQGILSQYDDAYDSLLLSLSILREDLGAQHVEVADVHSAIADVCLKIYAENPQKRDPKKIEEAKRHVEAALKIAKESFGENHTKTQQFESLLFICSNFDSLS